MSHSSLGQHSKDAQRRHFVLTSGCGNVKWHNFAKIYEPHQPRSSQQSMRKMRSILFLRKGAGLRTVAFCAKRARATWALSPKDSSHAQQCAAFRLRRWARKCQLTRPCMGSMSHSSLGQHNEARGTTRKNAKHFAFANGCGDAN